MLWLLGRCVDHTVGPTKKCVSDTIRVRRSDGAQVAHIMAKPVTALLYIDKDPTDSTADESQGSGFVWWWTKGGTMHVHDVLSNNTMTKFIPSDRVSPKSVVRVLVLDTTQRWVWAGHDDGCALVDTAMRAQLTTVPPHVGAP